MLGVSLVYHSEGAWPFGVQALLKLLIRDICVLLLLSNMSLLNSVGREPLEWLTVITPNTYPTTPVSEPVFFSG